jgi:hypothetical protein
VKPSLFLSAVLAPASKSMEAHLEGERNRGKTGRGGG